MEITTAKAERQAKETRLDCRDDSAGHVVSALSWNGIYFTSVNTILAIRTHFSNFVIPSFGTFVRELDTQYPNQSIRMVTNELKNVNEKISFSDLVG